jgi:hypothetical protein
MRDDLQTFSRVFIEVSIVVQATLCGDDFSTATLEKAILIDRYKLDPILVEKPALQL